MPTSLFECIIEIKATLPLCFSTASFNSVRSIKPFRSTFIPTIFAPSCSANQIIGSITAWCSKVEVIITFLLSLAPFQNKPLIARLFASVPDAVKITSLGAQSIADAISSRPCSKSLRTERPAECREDALPNFFN